MRVPLWLIAGALVVALAGTAAARQGTDVKEMRPGGHADTIETNKPGMPVRMPAMNVTQYVTTKDREEGRAFLAQKDAGVDCHDSNVRSAPGRFSFAAACRTPGDMVVEGHDGRHRRRHNDAHRPPGDSRRRHARQAAQLDH